jgi:integrase
MDLYLDWANDHKRPRAIEESKRAFLEFMGFVQLERVGAVTRLDIERFKQWHLKKGTKKITVNNKLRDIQAVIGRGIRQGFYTGENPVVGIERYKVDRPTPEFHTVEELNRLLEVARSRSQELEWTVLLGGWAGMRKMEIVNARWEWFKFNRKEPVIHITPHEGFDIKDHESRFVAMSKKIIEILKPHSQSKGYLFVADKNPGKSRYRFDPKKSLDAALINAGLTTKKPYQRLRSTFGSLHVQAGVPLAQVSRWMGHESVATTERHYAGLLAYSADIDSF